MYVVTIDEDKCTGCGACVDGCPAEVFKMVDGKAEVAGDDCLGCQSCIELCPVDAITVDEY